MRKQKNEYTEVIETIDIATKDSPAVLAYRVGQLEKTVKEGLESVNEKLDKLSGFVTKEDADRILKDAESKAGLVHKDLEDRIKLLETFKNDVVGRIALYAVLLFVAMVLGLYGLNKFL